MLQPASAQTVAEFYRGRQINGESKPDPDMIVALEQCKHGQAAAGIATLEQRLRSANMNLPPR